MQLAHDAGLPSPRVLHVLKPEEGLGRGFIMPRIEGETIARKICATRSSPRRGRCWRGNLAGSPPAFTDCRRRNCRSCARYRDEGNRRSRARIPQHQLAAPGVRAGAALAARPRSRPVARGDAGARRFPPRQSHHRPRRRARRAGLGDRASRRSHGGSGWICINSWRFGEIDKPVGGFGSREDLFAGYEEAGRKVDPDRVMFWEVMGTLRWGIMCGRMMQRFRNAPDHPMEQAMIGRRPSETEIDLLRLLAPRGK